MKFPAVLSRPALILAVFTTAIFTSALLLFAVQPMFARMVLPILGGAPSVWSVAMVFFQAMLFVGYLYAHVLMRARRPAVAIVVHLVVLAIAGLSLPLAIATEWGEPPASFAALWLLGLFAVSIGLPFFALSANNPLLQAWFVHTGHRDGRDPYFLYAASNVGSFLALLSYPVVLEPMLTLKSQSLMWTAGFWLLFALIAACGWLVLRASLPPGSARMPVSEPSGTPRTVAFGAWVFLAAVPSGLLVAVTAYISTDLAAVPLLWVVPLSLYLLTWVIVFQRRPLLAHRWMLVVQPVAIAGLVALLAVRPLTKAVVVLAAHLLAFFVIALACHGELARRRPPSGELTTFYVSLSLGGMIGGLFAGLIAPNVFTWIAEYPILIVCAALCRPFPAGPMRLRAEVALWGLVVAVALAALVPAFVGSLPEEEWFANNTDFAIAVVAALGVLLARDPPKFACLIAVALCMARLYPSDERQIETVRSFFGVHKIYDTDDGRFRVLMHGTTIHGAQMLKDADGQDVRGTPAPLTYYAPGFGLAQTIEAVRSRKGAPISVAVVGLGTGSLACHMRPQDDWRFFEIDASVVAIARDSGRFDFLRACAPDVPIVLGDARLTLARQGDRRYDLIIVDAFSSDSIPVHLMTREAMALYKARLAPHGVVAMHVSNRHLELSSVVAGIAAANGLATWVYKDNASKAADEDYVFNSDVAISAARPGDIGALATSRVWWLAPPDADQRVWTDDYSNIVGALWRK